ncbi:TetR/AcrR family transcriptional regulator [Treponema putidum]|uniref:TetR/AcrR family transcriptional regulator n=1 Tax=Treponema putidum TaxID=221027 RepID=A0AAE9MUA0_9SPIR|nr:TetR/AcrR family transcriptional regulator [Treponema putidum]AIN94774.1 TetR family transcriptional regulator [Treponema putidum]TWI77652.1 TetR family transcriptional regulator [Treponema putidum]UTY28799.1 TetR/AcrR family transcriptional regulator [Treponema putidum]UTY31226.1 TetR/AcrR family transcriptional regulator [Treponema putidum]UTY33665.1 TetR/AcrR family transcriptional regulator [Treponema putidum]
MMEESKKKNETYTEILKNAKTEFLQKGFEKASMRSIAAMTGITAGALYKHFLSKAAIFDALVQPLITQTLSIGTDFSKIAMHLYETKDFLSTKEAIRDSLQNLCTLVYSRFDEFKLLFNRSAGTKYENIRHEFVMADVTACKKFIADLKKRGININPLDDDRLHLIYSTALTPLFEIITHEYSYKKALSFIDILTDVMYFCWNKIMQPEAEINKEN